MRLFTAVDIGQHARDAIAVEQRRVMQTVDGWERSLRLVRAENVHLTLVFIGEVSDDRVTPFVETMRSDIPLEPFAMAFAGLGVFPPHGAPRVLWLGVAEGAAQATALHAVVADRLAALGIKKEARPFRAHLTLARWRDGRRSDRPRLEQTPRLIARTEVKAATLYQSRLSPAGPTYTALAQAELKRST